MYNYHIDTFISVVDSGSFSKAAEKLYLSVVSVMNQVNALEDHVGVKLLERTNRGIILTDAGRSIYQDAKRIIQESELALNRARQIAEGESHTIRIAFSNLNPHAPFLHILEQLRVRHPQYKIKIVPFDDNQENLLNCVPHLETRYELIVGICGSTQIRSLCNFYELGTFKKCVALSRSHRLANKDILNIEDLYGEKLMLVKRGDSPTNDRLRDLLESQHPQITIIDAPQFYNIDVFNECEEHGYILSTFDVWSNIHPSLVTIPVNWDFAVPYGLLSSKTPSNKTATFLDTIKAITEQA